MKTFYREKRYYCGDYLEVHCYPVHPCKKAVKSEDGRRRKRKETSQTKQLINEKESRERAARILNKNFTGNDLALTMTYDSYNRPETEEEADRQLTKFLRRLRKIYKKYGIELKWMATTEGPKYHHHLVISGGVDRDLVEQAWGMGYCNTRRLQLKETGAASWAYYMTKARKQDKQKGEHTYRRSRNLIEPEPQISDCRIESRRKADQLAGQDGTAWEELAEGYELAEVERYAELTGQVYFVAKLYSKTGYFGRKERRHNYACKRTEQRNS